ncbi:MULTISPECIES: hypothetical protein [Pseudobutyrivibrio]|jgi:hypothetical protein|uniref:Multidrug transporter n=1 Tax=Pseudobutyrivibrio xylanivorans TaxID=185007 RepID=A0A1G5RY94_PSEXY|nr:MULTISPECIES: hypothetical protein [Pseudobutyrivibrio]MDC7279263.1 hypothetical protein [Butyrivibrio fibrisolvens]SCZ78976.1 hypothetical protein SAMN02910350_01564 [Pseudobutyrivibrio xylanivorans]
MFTLLFFVLFFMVFGKMIGFAFRATWGLTKILFSVVFLPLILIGLVFGGLLYIAFPVLLVVGLVSLIANA